MTQEQVSVSTREIESLVKRNQHLQERFTRADIDCHRLAEDLLTANAKVDQLRNESANLRAEKKIWEVIWFPSASPIVPYIEEILECSRPPHGGKQDANTGEVPPFRSHGQRSEDAQRPRTLGGE